MHQKTLTFDDDVLAALRKMEFTEGDDGLVLGDITEKLDPALYRKVKKAITVLNGKWNRALQTHIFEGDPRPQLGGILDEGEITIDKDDFFETPPEVVKIMLGLVPYPPSGRVLEPSAGLGAIIRKFPEGPLENIMAVEWNEDRAMKLTDEFRDRNIRVFQGDFLELEPSDMDVIYMNPPFSHNRDIQHVLHAWKWLVPNGMFVSVMSEHAFVAGDKASVEFRAWMQKYGIANKKLPENSFKDSGTGVRTRLVYGRKPVIKHEHTSKAHCTECEHEFEPDLFCGGDYAKVEESSFDEKFAGVSFWRECPNCGADVFLMLSYSIINVTTSNAESALD